MAFEWTVSIGINGKVCSCRLEACGGRARFGGGLCRSLGFGGRGRFSGRLSFGGRSWLDSSLALRRCSSGLGGRRGDYSGTRTSTGTGTSGNTRSIRLSLDFPDFRRSLSDLMIRPPGNDDMILDGRELTSGIQVGMGDGVVRMCESGGRGKEGIVCFWSRHGGWHGQRGGN